MPVPERFELARTSRWLFLATPWLMAMLAALCLALPFLPDDGRPKNEAFVAGFSAFGFAMFGAGTWYSVRTVRRLPLAAISLDHEGLWPTVLNRETAIVKWGEITRVRERPALQRLELVDRYGVVKMRLEYQLQAFERIRAIVLERAALAKQARAGNGTYTMPWWHHPFSVGAMFGFSLLGWYAGQTNPILGYGGMAAVVVVIAWEYSTIPYRLRLAGGTLELAFPGRTRSIPRAQVTNILLADEFHNMVRRPHVVIQLAGGQKPIHVKGLGLPSTDLHQVLKSWSAGL
jgi:hypothetical protein